MKLKELLALITSDNVIKIKNYTDEKTIIECESQQTGWLNNAVLESEVKSIQPTKVRNLTVKIKL